MLSREWAISVYSIRCHQTKSQNGVRSPTSAYGYMPIGQHTTWVFWNIIEMTSKSMVVVSVRILGTTRGSTVRVLSGDQRIQHGFQAWGDSIDVSYPYVRMNSIWLSDSSNWAWPVCDSLSELINTHGGSRGGCNVWAGELLLTCKAFDFRSATPGWAHNVAVDRAGHQLCSENVSGL